MSSTLGGSSGEGAGAAADRHAADSSFVEFRWVLYLLGLEAVLVVAGFAIDAAAGPVSDGTRMMHEIAGLLGAFAVLFAVVGVIVFVPVAYSVFRARRRY